MNVGPLGALTVTNTTNSTSPITGAIVTTGGAGIALDVNVGGTSTSNNVTGTTLLNVEGTTPLGSYSLVGGLECNLFLRVLNAPTDPYDVVRLKDIMGVIENGVIFVDWEYHIIPFNTPTPFHLMYREPGTEVTLYQAMASPFTMDPQNPVIVGGFVELTNQLQPDLVPFSQWSIPVMIEVGAVYTQALLTLYTNGNV